MQRVLVLSATKQPLMPCDPARARQLLKQGRAAVYWRYPFTIILQDRREGDVQPIQFKVDPGSRQTGIALVAEGKRGNRVVFAAVLEHRGHIVHQKLLDRQQLRQSRRNRKTRYRPARFNNRRRQAGWLPPSIESRIGNIQTWFKRLSRLTPLDSISLELVKFDTQMMQNPEISGIEYQQGELAGYEVREYLLEKWKRKCAYCGAENVRLEIEHITPQARGGSNRVTNLVMACHECNQRKGSQTAAEFGYPDVQRRAKQPLQDTAAVNTARWALWRWLELTGLPLETGTGGRTKFNRIRQNYPKAHWIDAACVGESGEHVALHPEQPVLAIKATGRGSRQMCRTDKYGFPVRYRLRQKRHFGFQTGDIVHATVSAGKYRGKYVGRITCRARGVFDLQTVTGKVATNHSNCTIIHHSDGYTYERKSLTFLPMPQGGGFR